MTVVEGSKREQIRFAGPSTRRPDKRTRASALVYLRDHSLAVAVIVCVLLLASVSLFPALYGFYLSLTDTKLTGGAVHFLGLANYRTTLGSGQFWSAAKLTAIYTVIAVVIEVGVGTLVAYELSLERRGDRLLRVASIVPLAIPPLAAGLMWKLFLAPGSGLADYILSPVGASTVDWYGSPHLALAAIVAVDVWLFTPFVILIMTAAIRALPAETIEAAALDGAGRLRRLVHVVVPLTKTRLYLILLFRVAYALSSFDLIMGTTGGGPGNSTSTVSFYIYEKGYVEYVLGRATTYGFLLFAVMFVLAQVLTRRCYSLQSAERA